MAKEPNKFQLYLLFKEPNITAIFYIKLNLSLNNHVSPQSTEKSLDDSVMYIPQAIFSALYTLNMCLGHALGEIPGNSSYI